MISESSEAVHSGGPGGVFLHTKRVKIHETMVSDVVQNLKGIN